MSRRMWLLAVTAWVAVVVAGSAITWVAIDRAGQQVSGNPTAGGTAPAVVGTLGSAPTATRTPRHKPSATPTGHPSSSNTSAPPPASSTTRSHDTATPKTSAPSTARTETRTWSGTAGQVTVACTGGTARLKGTSPSDGWHVEVSDTYGSEVQVKFVRNESEVQVEASCVGGVPRFQVESGGSGEADN